MKFTRLMVPETDRGYLPEDLEGEELAAWWGAFRTGREAERAEHPAAPSARPAPAPSNSRIKPPPPAAAVTPVTSEATSDGDGYDTPAEEPQWLADILVGVAKSVPVEAFARAEQRIRTDSRIKEWVAGSPPSERTIIATINNILEKAKIKKPGENW